MCAKWFLGEFIFFFFVPFMSHRFWFFFFFFIIHFYSWYINDKSVEQFYENILNFLSAEKSLSILKLSSFRIREIGSFLSHSWLFFFFPHKKCKNREMFFVSILQQQNWMTIWTKVFMNFMMQSPLRLSLTKLNIRWIVLVDFFSCCCCFFLFFIFIFFCDFIIFSLTFYSICFCVWRNESM